VFFALSKIVWFLIEPSNVVALLVLLGAVLLAVGWLRIGRVVALAGAALLVLIGVLPTYLLLLRPLENRFVRPDWPAHIDGIVILSGGINSGMIKSRGVPATERSLGRIVAGFEVARRYPNARVIFSGGSGALGGSKFSEAEGARFIFAQMGMDPARLILEDRSRNTSENLILSKRIADPKRGEVWLLATTAWHIPRSMGVAARNEWQMVPWPTDYATAKQGFWGGFFSISHNLSYTDVAVREWIGLAAYRLTGRSGAPK